MKRLKSKFLLLFIAFVALAGCTAGAVSALNFNGGILAVAEVADSARGNRGTAVRHTKVMVDVFGLDFLKDITLPSFILIFIAIALTLIILYRFFFPKSKITEKNEKSKPKKTRVAFVDTGVSAKSLAVAKAAISCGLDSSASNNGTGETGRQSNESKERSVPSAVDGGSQRVRRDAIESGAGDDVAYNKTSAYDYNTLKNEMAESKAEDTASKAEGIDILNDIGAADEIEKSKRRYGLADGYDGDIYKFAFDQGYTSAATGTGSATASAAIDTTENITNYREALAQEEAFVMPKAEPRVSEKYDENMLYLHEIRQKIAKNAELLEQPRFNVKTMDKEERLIKAKQLAERIAAEATAKLTVGKEKEAALLREQKIVREREEALARLRLAELEVAKAKEEAMEKEKRLTAQFSAETEARMAVAKEKEEVVLREQKIASEREATLERLRLAEFEAAKVKEEATRKERLLAERFSIDDNTRISLIRERETALHNEQRIAREREVTLRRLRLAELEVAKAKEEAREKEKRLSIQFSAETAARIAISREKEAVLSREQKIANEIEETLRCLKAAELEVVKAKEEATQKEKGLLDRLEKQLEEETSAKIALRKEKNEALLREQKIAREKEETEERLQVAELELAKNTKEATEREREKTDRLIRRLEEETAARIALAAEKEDARLKDEALLREQEITKERQEATERLRAAELEISTMKETAVEEERTAQLMKQLEEETAAKIAAEKEDARLKDEALLREQEITRERQETTERLRAAELEISTMKETAVEKERTARLMKQLEEETAARIALAKGREEVYLSEQKIAEQKAVNEKEDTDTVEFKTANTEEAAAKQDVEPTGQSAMAAVLNKKTEEMDALIENILQTSDELNKLELEKEDIEFKREIANDKIKTFSARLENAPPTEVAALTALIDGERQNISEYDKRLEECVTKLDNYNSKMTRLDGEINNISSEYNLKNKLRELNLVRIQQKYYHKAESEKALTERHIETQRYESNKKLAEQSDATVQKTKEAKLDADRLSMRASQLSSISEDIEKIRDKEYGQDLQSKLDKFEKGLREDERTADIMLEIGKLYGAIKHMVEVADLRAELDKKALAESQRELQAATLNQAQADRQSPEREVVRTRTIIKTITNNIHHVPKRGRQVIRLQGDRAGAAHSVPAARGTADSKATSAARLTPKTAARADARPVARPTVRTPVGAHSPAKTHSFEAARSKARQPANPAHPAARSQFKAGPPLRHQ
jgi:hypothetical protein